MRINKFLISGIITASFLMLLIMGISQRKTYTNITETNVIPDEAKVCLLSDTMLNDGLVQLKSIEEEAPIILKVKAVDQVEFVPHLYRQKVEIEKIYKNDSEFELNEASDIFVAKSSNFLDFVHEDEFSLQSSYEMMVNTGFANTMIPGNEYLVFLETKVDNILKEDTETFYSFDSFLYTVFAYQDAQNPAFPQRFDSLYVNYAEVKQNEFYAASEEGYQQLMDRKHELLLAFN